MNDRTILHIKPHDEGWQVIREGGKRASAVKETKDEAKEVAQQYLEEKDDVTGIVTHKKDGSVEKDQPDNTILHIKPHPDGWQLIREGAGRASAVEDIKKDALEKADRYLREFDNVSKIVIHKKDGSVSRTKKSTKPLIKDLPKEEKIDTAVYKDSNMELPYPIWSEKLQDKEPLKKEDKGRRVHVVGESSRRQCFLHDVHNPGEDMWPDGGYEIYWRTKDYITCHFFEEVRLHKSERN